MRILAEDVFQQMTMIARARMFDTKLSIKNLDARPSVVHQCNIRFFELLQLGVYDNWQLFNKQKCDGENDIRGQHPLFVNQVVFLWPLVYGTCQAQKIQEEGILSGCFRGGAANTFRDIVEAIGFNETTYPYYALSEAERATREKRQ